VKTQQMTKYILGGAIAAGLTLFCVSSSVQAKEKKMNEALTINGNGAQRNPDIHWPKGQHPEDADLYAHNEIMVNASRETVFANIVDAQSWPSWYPNSHNVGELHQGSHSGTLSEGRRPNSQPVGENCNREALRGLAEAGCRRVKAAWCTATNVSPVPRVP
jgi:hypothetical protein